MSNIKNLKEINWDNVKLAKSGRAIKLLYEIPFNTIKDKAARKNNSAVDLVRGLN